MIKRDIIIVDYFSKITATEISDSGRQVLEKLNLHVKNIRKYRGKIERRKEKIKRIYE
jgi:hypothetical protein